MPEGDTVWLHAHRLHEALAGRQLTSTDFRVPRLATTDLTGWTVTDVVSRGKHILLRAASPETSTSPTGAPATTGASPHPTPAARRLTLRSHLRMDGRWRLFRPGTRWAGPGHEIRVVLATGNITAVGYHLHDLALVPTEEENSLVGHLGPDLLGPDWDPDEAVRRLRGVPERRIAAALLDQRNLAGIGNLYKCEILFLRRINPWTPIGDVEDLPAAVELAHRLLELNKHRWEQITTGGTGRDEGTWVYDRANRPCRRSGTRIRQVKENDERITYWCPTCQPGPAPA